MKVEIREGSNIWLSYTMRHNDANKMTPLSPLHLSHFENFDKVNVFLKPALNICILSNLVVGWGEWVIKEAAVILHQIYRFSGGFNTWTRIHQSKSWYYLGRPFQTSKVDFFAEIIFGYKSLTYIVKDSNLDVSLVPLDAS